MQVQEARNRLLNAPQNPGHLTPETFENEGQRSAATTSDRERIARLKLKAPLVVRAGDRFQITVPAYERFTTDGTAGNTETFNLSHSVMETPNTENIIVWEEGSYVGAEGAFDAIDYDANTVDYTDDGTDTTLHLWYVSDAGANFEIEKVTSSQNSQQGLFSSNLRLVHRKNHSEQPEDPDASKTPLNAAVATDMFVDLYIDSAYTFRWSDPDGDGAYPTNLLFDYPVNRVRQQIPGLESAVASDMSQE